jgi:magnesium chelatase accessory protein
MRQTPVIQAPDWERDGAAWPNRASSRFVTAGGVDWHVQQAGQGPVLLLLHGTGAATHSFRDLLPALAADFTVVAPDLPGHGFSGWPEDERSRSRRGMAEALGALLSELGLEPVLAVGHSAGAALAATLEIQGRIRPAAIVALNGALLPLRSVAWHFFAPVAKVLACSPFATRLFARSAEDRASVLRLLRGTGSEIEPAGIDQYALLARSERHVAAAIGMMARWDLDDFARELPRLETDLVLIVGSNDKSVPPSDAGRVATIRQGGRGRTRLATLPGLGHLAHEEAPARVAELIRQAAREAGVLPAPKAAAKTAAKSAANAS